MNILSTYRIKLTLATCLAVCLLTACGHKDDKTTADNQAAASATEAAAAPMTAAPADNKGTPAVVNESNATVDAGPDVAAASSAGEVEVGASNVAPEEAMDGGADNSGMDKISENDQVIDDQPASPNAPRAPEETNAPVHESKAIGNAKVGK